MDLDAEWEAFEGRERLVAEVGDANLARQIFYGMEARSFEWLDEPVPALNGKTPRQCLKTREGRRLLGSVAAHFPL